VFDSLGLASNDATVRLVRGDRVLTLRIARSGRVTLDGA
jgi:general secretion pathway protein H